MKQFLITEEFRNGLIAYFNERPYKEAANAIYLLSDLVEAPAEQPTTEENAPPLGV